jgi:hypothetical protein
MPKRRFLWSISLAIATWSLLALIRTALPHSDIGGQMTDLLAAPGAWVVGLVYPEGPHTGRGVSNWGAYVILCNFTIYALFWYLVLRVAGLLRTVGPDHKLQR